jgi:hypothetical protein
MHIYLPISLKNSAQFEVVNVKQFAFHLNEKESLRSTFAFKAGGTL